jgi:hypothetical protein
VAVGANTDCEKGDCPETNPEEMVEGTCAIGGVAGCEGIGKRISEEYSEWDTKICNKQVRIQKERVIRSGIPSEQDEVKDEQFL